MKKKAVWAALMTIIVVVLIFFIIANPTEKEIVSDAYSDTEWNIFSIEENNGMHIKIVDENIMLQPDIVVRVDSEENENVSASMLKDGIVDDINMRWSSANDWEDNEHWIEVEFEKETEVGCVRLYWERLNALDYALEISEDGSEWKTIACYKEAPVEKRQDIILKECVQTKYLRLHIFDVVKKEEDGSLYYQNVSLLEMEVYGAFKDELVVNVPKIEKGTGRNLETRLDLDGYVLEFAGADYENVIDTDGNIADTLSDVSVEIGYRLYRDGHVEELPAMKVNVPGSFQNPGNSVLPVGYEVMEWLPADGTYKMADSCEIYVEKELLESADLLAKELIEKTGKTVKVVEIDDEKQLENVTTMGHIFMCLSDDITAQEGYRLELGTRYKDMTVIEGLNIQGIRWGCVSYLELLEKTEAFPKGTIYDYPRYEVRGFGIDVARRCIEMDMLYRIVEEMSLHKMNTLQVHLNDNQIIAQSDHGGTVEGVRGLYSAFRLESDMKGNQGIALTSTDLYYTKEEFMEFVKYAEVYGVEVVPEIDSPGHSLCFIKLLPEIGRDDDFYVADQLNLSNEKSTEMIKQIWSEYLVQNQNGKTVFEDCDTVHIGMDEYFGNRADFMTYIDAIYSHIKEVSPNKKIRMWGSLAAKDGDYSQISRDIELQLWSMEWTDPLEMYEAGFDIINSQNTHLYIIPGSGYDRLDMEYLEKEWDVNVFENEMHRWEIPSYSLQMKGACYMMWNDMIMMDGIEITEEDIFDRFYEPLNLISERLWK